MTVNKNQGMNGTGHSMHTAQQNKRASGTGQGITSLLRAAILGLILTLGLSLGYGQVQAEEGDRNTRQVQRSDNDKADGKKSDKAKQDDGKKRDDKVKREKDREKDHEDRDNNGGNNGGNNNGGQPPAANIAPTVSLTAPASNSLAIAPASFTLAANAADADGSIAKVDFYANGTLVGSAAAAPYSFAWSNVAVGAYNLTAIATDNLGAATTSGAIAVTVNANQAPTVSLTSPAANSLLTAPANLTIAANAADNDGTITKVDFYDGTTLLGTATTAPYGFAWSNIATGIHSLTVIATDNLGAVTTSGAVNLTVIAPPVVSLAAPASNTILTAPATFTLTADATSAGSIVKVDFYNGATLIGTATTAPHSVTWSNVAAGSYTITAVATDGNGATTASAPIGVIANAAPAVNLTTPAANSILAAPASFTLTVDATDSDGTIAKVEFYNGTTLLGTATAAPYSYIWSNVPAGNYTLTAITTDNAGAQTTSAAVAVTSNHAPTVSLTSPAANTVSVAPGSFTLTADATDADGTIAKVDFHADGALIGTATTAPYSYTWTNVPAGTHSLTAIASDNAGAQTTSAAVSVISDAPPTISLTSPAANAVSIAPGSFTLTADATSTTSTVAKVDYYANSAGTNTLIGTATTAPYSFDWSNVPAGIYSLMAVATDTLGTTATSAAITVTSDQAPAVALTGPATGAQITSPNSFTITATADSVTSTIAKVEFYNGTTLLGTATAAPYSFTWTNVPVGSYDLTAKAIDALGIATTSLAVHVTAIANVPPTVSLTGPANGATVKVPGSFTLTADAASTTSAVAKVDFYAIDNATNAGTLIGTATQAPYTTNWSNIPLGDYTLSAVATDTLGAVTTSSQVSVTVNTGIAQAYYIHTDHLNSPRSITDTAGNNVWQWDNTDPFGNNIANENPNSQGNFAFNLRFPGQYFDRETNTHYNFLRDAYDPATGRYTQSDPIGLAGGINTYTYVNGNPLSYVDPEGLLIMSTIDGLQRGTTLNEAATHGMPGNAAAMAGGAAAAAGATAAAGGATNMRIPEIIRKVLGPIRGLIKGISDDALPPPAPPQPQIPAPPAISRPGIIPPQVPPYICPK